MKILYYKNGTKWYAGEIENGVPHGNGTYYFFNGNKHYEGEIENGEPHGNGTHYFEDGRWYVGEWKDGQNAWPGNDISQKC